LAIQLRIEHQASSSQQHLLVALLDERSFKVPLTSIHGRSLLCEVEEHHASSEHLLCRFASVPWLCWIVHLLRVDDELCVFAVLLDELQCSLNRSIKARHHTLLLRRPKPPPHGLKRGASNASTA